MRGSRAASVKRAAFQFAWVGLGTALISTLLGLDIAVAITTGLLVAIVSVFASFLGEWVSRPREASSESPESDSEQES